MPLALGISFILMKIMFISSEEKTLKKYLEGNI